MHSEDKPRYDYHAAAVRAQALQLMLAPFCERIEVVGSLRRRRPTVGDIELLYIPRFGPQARGPGDLYPDEQTRCNLADTAIADLERRRILGRRLNTKGQTMFGEHNKLMVDLSTGIPVDLFATVPECWENYRVCRTGGAETNRRICEAAHALGWKWTPYGSGFTREKEKGCLEVRPVTSERDLFSFLGLPWLEPEARP